MHFACTLRNAAPPRQIRPWRGRTRQKAHLIPQKRQLRTRAPPSASASPPGARPGSAGAMSAPQTGGDDKKKAFEMAKQARQTPGACPGVPLTAARAHGPVRSLPSRRRWSTASSCSESAWREQQCRTQRLLAAACGDSGKTDAARAMRRLTASCFDKCVDRKCVARASPSRPGAVCVPAARWPTRALPRVAFQVQGGRLERGGEQLHRPLRLQILAGASRGGSRRVRLLPHAHAANIGLATGAERPHACTPARRPHVLARRR
jgi:hypothetical protein